MIGKGELIEQKIDFAELIKFYEQELAKAREKFLKVSNSTKLKGVKE